MKIVTMQSHIDHSVESKTDVSKAKIENLRLFLEGPGIDGNIKLNIISFLAARDVEAMNSIRHFRGDISKENPLPENSPKLFQHYKAIPKNVFKKLNECGNKCFDCDRMYQYLCINASFKDGLAPHDAPGACCECLTCAYTEERVRLRSRTNDLGCHPCCCVTCEAVFCLPCYAPRLICTFLSCLTSLFFFPCGLAIDARDAYQIKHRKKETGIELKKLSIYALKQQQQQQQQQLKLSAPQEQSMEDEPSSTTLSW